MARPAVEIRDVRAADEPALRAIQRDVIDEPSPQLLGAATEGLAITRVAVDDQPVGYGFALVGDDTAYVPELAVASAHRRRGIGTALLDSIAERAGEAGATTLRLTVHADDERAKAFYRSCGFEEIARHQQYFATGSGVGIDLAKPL
ncbi:Pab acetyltransferase protein [Halorhabdus tiamatea SARL4B]|uniref:Pab N-terminal acetyltransferase n=1 Tax=Halorhabdus tiamatea SARL4B TaxID=1033806 RepID=F7PHW2_9EURY|nr:N-acetyltransferase [Halorhabdus tiamatea]ERJ06956.1 Pab acetyltransferase protein [Halorhabdus tiamatea SARL4B]CCQ32343.1 Pab N-terminal acetyltransferase [Halorhabdus tiamatea SARL4B]